MCAMGFVATCPWQRAPSEPAVLAGDADARERLFSLGGDALAEQLDASEGAAVDPEQLKSAAAAHARRFVLWTAMS